MHGNKINGSLQNLVIINFIGSLSIIYINNGDWLNYLILK